MKGGRVVEQAIRGCLVIVQRKERRVEVIGGAFEIVGVEVLDAPIDVDICVDPSDALLSIPNSTSVVKSVTLSVVDGQVEDHLGNCAPHGEFVDTLGNVVQCSTIICVVQPMSIVDIGYLTNLDARIESDVRDVVDFDLKETDEQSVVEIQGFPLPIDQCQQYLCTQGFNGPFTHFYSGTRYAVDFRCSVGTPVLAVGDGKVVSIRQDSMVTGVHVSNLFNWNSIMIELDLPHVFVEYVHIQQHSAQVKVGDRVSKGQVLCFSGQAGFCPEPHLHFQVQPSAENDALTLPFVFVINGMQIKPESGQCYPFRIRNSGI